jgi:hypothetical protein
MNVRLTTDPRANVTTLVLPLIGGAPPARVAAVKNVDVLSLDGGPVTMASNAMTTL